MNLADAFTDLFYRTFSSLTADQIAGVADETTLCSRLLQRGLGAGSQPNVMAHVTAG